MTTINTAFPEVLERARFNSDDLLAIVQAFCGFASAAVTRDPIGLIDAAAGSAFLGEHRCPLGDMETNAATLKKWLNFGQHYQALEDPSDLNFDQVDVEAIPEVMQVKNTMVASPP